jgi:hypothetical protein
MAIASACAQKQATNVGLVTEGLDSLNAQIRRLEELCEVLTSSRDPQPREAVGVLEDRHAIPPSLAVLLADTPKHLADMGCRVATCVESLRKLC